MVASYVVRGTTGLRSVRQADDLQCWMSVRVRCLALEGLEGATQDVGLRSAEVLRQTLEALTLDGVEIYLHRLADPSLCAHDRRSCDHEYWS